MNKKTYFTAVPLPADVKRRLFEWQEKSKAYYPFRKWVYEEDYHITLKYLGACDEDQLERVKEQLAAIRYPEPFDLTLTGIGIFGRREIPRILWAGVQGDLVALQRLQTTVETAMEQLGFAAENRPYRPHATLAKNFQGTSFDSTAMSASWDHEMKLPSWRVESIVLYRTELGRNPMYIVEREYAFPAP